MFRQTIIGQLEAHTQSRRSLADDSLIEATSSARLAILFGRFGEKKTCFRRAMISMQRQLTDVGERTH